MKSVVFSMSIHSARGVDGWSGKKFQAAWDIIKHDVLKAVNFLLKGGIIPRSVNATLLVIIPKKLNPVSFADFRPISLCNFLYKIFTKFLTSRLALLLAVLVSEEQHGFVKGRGIGECISLAQLMVNDLDRKVEGGNMILKLDMMKAYDRIEWDFFLKVLSCFGFSELFVKIIGNCLGNQNITVCVNVLRRGFFPAARGLRQGDPISPCLFVLAEEVLSRGLCRIYQQGLVKGFHLGRGSSLVSHLLFADDTLIFLRGLKKSLEHLMIFLKEYEMCSGRG